VVSLLVADGDTDVVGGLDRIRGAAVALTGPSPRVLLHHEHHRTM
jgi:hypothetical protein